MKHKRSKEAHIATECISLETFYSFDHLTSMQQEWDQFIESIKGEVFLTYDWCRVWWKYYGNHRDLMIFIFRNGGTICGILPVFRESIRLGPFCIRAIKIVGTDFIPIAVSIPIKPDLMDQVIRMFFDELNLKVNWDILHLGAISGRYKEFDNLVAVCKKNLKDHYAIQTKTSDVQTYYKIADSLEEQIASLSKVERKRLRRTFKELDTLGISLNSSFASGSNLTNFFDSFYRMHQLRWQQEGKAGHFVAWPSSYEFHKEISLIQLKYNRLRLQEIKLNNRPVGYKYAYKFGETYFAFLDSRAEIELSPHISFFRIAFSEQLKEARKEKVEWIDSMRGKYEHKLQLGGQLFPIKSIYIHSKKLYPLLRISLFRSFAWALTICYYKIWRARIAPRLSITPRPFWEFWIRTHILSY